MTNINPEAQERRRFTVMPDRSAIVLDVITSVGPVAFGATGLEGFVEAAVHQGEVDLTVAPAAHLELAVNRLTSGNTIYDGELRRHINARGFPTAYLDLYQVVRLEGASSSYRVAGELTVRGITRPVEGVVSVDFPEPEAMVVRGQESVDIRAFDIPPPEVFLIRIEPEIKLSLHLEVREAAAPSAEPIAQ